MIILAVHSCLILWHISYTRNNILLSLQGDALIHQQLPHSMFQVSLVVLKECVDMLRLSTPNIVSMDLVVFPFFLYLIRLTYDNHTAPMLLFSFCTPHLTNLHAVHGYVLLLSFHSATTMRWSHVSLLFHYMAMLDARFHLMPLDTGIF